MNYTVNTIPAKRQQNIMEYLLTENTITIKEAANLCQVSESTARRDLDEMAAQGLVERTHGGAIIETGTSLEQKYSDKMRLMIPEKTRIASEAARLIRNGNSIFLDSGTTTYLLAKQLLMYKNLTVITHNLDIAYHIKLDQTSSLVVTGGIRRDGFNVLVGEIAEKLVEKLSLDFAFIGADAINPKWGVFDSGFLELGIKRMGIASAKRKVLLCDHTKFMRKALTKVCDIEEFDTVITDEGLPEKEKKLLDSKIKNLIIV